MTTTLTTSRLETLADLPGDISASTARNRPSRGRRFTAPRVKLSKTIFRYAGRVTQSTIISLPVSRITRVRSVRRKLANACDRLLSDVSRNLRNERKYVRPPCSARPGNVGRWSRIIEKSERTPYLSQHHAPIGHEGLWHTPSKKVPEKQQLPALAYIQNIRNALMRNGHDEQSAHALAVGAVKRWASGKGKVHPEVRAAARRALQEWEALRAPHHQES